MIHENTTVSYDASKYTSFSSSLVFGGVGNKL